MPNDAARRAVSVPIPPTPEFLAERYREGHGGVPSIALGVRGPAGPYPVLLREGALDVLGSVLRTIRGCLPLTWVTDAVRGPWLGIGTATLVIGAVAERFLAGHVEDVEMTEDEVLAGVRDISLRVGKLERALAQRAQREASSARLGASAAGQCGADRKGQIF